MVRVCELVTCETVAVEMKGGKGERGDFLIFSPASEFKHPHVYTWRSVS